MSERRACKAVSIMRRVFRYEPKSRDDGALVEALSRLAREHPDLGFGKFFGMLRAEGRGWNHKRVHRVYCEMGLNKRRKHKRRLPARNPKPLAVPAHINQSWSADFMTDALDDGHCYISHGRSGDGDDDADGRFGKLHTPDGLEYQASVYQ